MNLRANQFPMPCDVSVFYQALAGVGLDVATVVVDAQGDVVVGKTAGDWTPVEETTIADEAAAHTGKRTDAERLSRRRAVLGLP